MVITGTPIARRSDSNMSKGIGKVITLLRAQGECLDETPSAHLSSLVRGALLSFGMRRDRKGEHYQTIVLRINCHAIQNQCFRRQTTSLYAQASTLQKELCYQEELCN